MYWILYLEVCGVLDTIHGSVRCTGYNDWKCVAVLDTIPGSEWCTANNTWKCVVYWILYLEVCGVLDTITGSVWCTGYYKR